MTTYHYTARQVAGELRRQGFPVLIVEEANECEQTDAEITLSDTVSVQVGAGYVCVNRWLDPETMYSGTMLALNPAGLAMLFGEVREQIALAAKGE